MAKLIRTPEELRAHLDGKVRCRFELDSVLANRLGIHVNSVTKLKHYGAAFDTPELLKKLGLRVVYEVSDPIMRATIRKAEK